MKKYIYIILFLQFGFADYLFSQTPLDPNLDKYWHYRARLLKYFMVVGPDQGESLPAGARNSDGSKMSWGDGPVYLGYYIGVLSTEWQLLKQSNQTTDQTLTELYYAMNAIRRLDIQADKEWEGFMYAADPAPERMNGFMLRDDVPLNFFEKHPELNTVCTQFGFNTADGTPGRDTSINSNWSGIHIYPDDLNKRAVTKMDNCDSSYFSASFDNLIQLIMGLALLERSIDPGNITFTDTYLSNINGFPTTSSANFVDSSRLYTTLITNYMKQGEFRSGEPWLLHYPDGNEICVKEGGHPIAYAYGIAKSAQYITGTDFQDYHTTANRSLYDYTSGTLARVTLGANARHDINMGCTLASICDNWGVVCQQGIHDQGTWLGYNIDLFYGLLNRYLNPSHQLQDDPSISDCDVKNLLTSAPYEGPWRWRLNDGTEGGGSGGWSSSWRFYADAPEQDGTLADGCYNGLDYMLLHNLYYLNNPIFTYYFTGVYPQFADNGAPLGLNYALYTPPFNGLMPINIINPTIVSSARDPVDGNTYIGGLNILGGPHGIDITDLTVNSGGVFHASCQPLIGCEPNITDYHRHMIHPHSTPSQNVGTANNFVKSSEFSSIKPESGLRNYPNPVSSETTIAFTLTKTANCTLEIADVSGKIIKVLFQNQVLSDGEYAIPYNLSDLYNGVFIYTLRKGDQRITRKLIKINTSNNQ